MVDVLVCAGEYLSNLSMLFRERFPSVFRFIVVANRRHRGTLISTLQALEAALIVEGVAPRLVDRIPVVTLHDAIYFRARDRPLVMDAFAASFAELGFSMNLKLEDQ